MSRRPVILAMIAAVLLVLVAAPGSPATGPLPGERIAPGVSAGGVDLSGLTVGEAAGKLEGALGERLGSNVAVRRIGRVFNLPARRAGVRLDRRRTAKRALYAGRDLPTGKTVEVPLALSHSQRAVARFAARVARGIRRSPRNATMRIRLRSVSFTHSRTGRRIDARALARAIDSALDDPTASRVFRPRLRRTRPPITANALRRANRTVITIDKRAFKLRLFKDGRRARTYGVAVGQPAYPTPSGLFAIRSKQVNPTWSVPNSPWAGELAGTTVRGGSAANPLKARWMGIVNGVGIHGTGEESSIGTRASHGCIRMRVRDVIALYRRVPIGTRVLIR